MKISMKCIFSFIFLNLFTLNLSFALDDTVIYAKGMHCGSCVESVTNEFKKFDQVESVKVTLDSGEVKIAYKKGTKSPQLTKGQIKEVLEEAGSYELVNKPLNSKKSSK